MRHRKFGRLGWPVSEVGYGMWGMGGWTGSDDAESLASLEQRLDPDGFVRVHRSAIVRLDRVREIRSTGPGESVLILRDGTRVPVSRRRREQVTDLIRRLTR